MRTFVIYSINDNFELLTSTATEFAIDIEDLFASLSNCSGDQVDDLTVPITGNATGTIALSAGDAPRRIVGYRLDFGLGSDATPSDVTVVVNGFALGSEPAASQNEAFSNTLTFRPTPGETSSAYVFFAASAQSGEYYPVHLQLEYDATTPMDVDFVVTGAPATAITNISPITNGSRYYPECLEFIQAYRANS